MKNSFHDYLIVMFLTCFLPATLNAASPPKVGEKAPDFTLRTLDSQSVDLYGLTASSNTVLVVLRGWPGYQCPYCTRQVQDYIKSASEFAASKARVVMVYPGRADDLEKHAKEFLGEKDWPKNFTFALDPAFKMVEAYGIRWNEPNETAYPSTFILDRKGIVRFAKIGHSHDDRTKAADIVDELDCMHDK